MGYRVYRFKESGDPVEMVSRAKDMLMEAHEMLAEACEMMNGNPVDMRRGRVMSRRDRWDGNGNDIDRRDDWDEVRQRGRYY